MSIHDSSYVNPHIFTFNSKDRISGTNSNFQSRPINLSQSQHYTDVCVIQASIPRTLYNVPLNYNSFILQEGAQVALITIPPASYNVFNIIPVLVAALNAASPNGWIYTMSFTPLDQPQNFRYTFTVSGNGGVQPVFVFGSGMFRVLGFLVATTNTFVANTLVSTTAVNFAYSSRAFIKSDLCQNTDRGILQEILNFATNCSPYTYCYFEQMACDLTSRNYNDQSRNSWNFTLVDGFDQEIDTNNVSWSFTVAFYARADTHEVQKTALMIQNEERLYEIEKKRADLLDKADKDSTTKASQAKTTTIIQHGLQLGMAQPNAISPSVPNTEIVTEEPTSHVTLTGSSQGITREEVLIAP